MSLVHSRRVALPKLAKFSIIDGVKARMTARVERRALAKLDDHLLDDIGVTRKQAWDECNRPFWELPDRHNW